MADLFSFEKILLLGSRSPRRHELLRQMGIPFRPVDISFDETALGPTTDPLKLARAKNYAYKPDLAPDEILLTADTLVILDNHVLGKPRDTRQAVQMLEQLAGRQHRVVTAVCMRSVQDEHCFSDTANVYFAPLHREEICHYVQNYMPLDKAGAYGIQDWIGLVGIRALEGSFYTVMGLPTHLVWRHWLALNGMELTGE